MIIVISPAKTLNFNKGNETLPITKPIFMEEAKELINELKDYDVFLLEKLMKMSPKLANLSYQRYKVWTDTLENAKQCLNTFEGAVYKGIDVGSFSIEDYFYANENLRILSGLYGVLRPFDGINPYRLEMGIKLRIKKSNNLYEYWGNKIMERIALDVESSKTNMLINLASYEYFKTIESIGKIKNIEVVTPIFKEYRNGEYKIITLMAKRARGLMTSYIIKNKIETLEDIKKFNYEGYEFNEELSKEYDLVFTRDNS